MSVRNIKKIVTGIHATDGAGVKLIRVFGHKDTSLFDPFLMLDAFDASNPDDYTKGFPWHPHRGIETLTYLISGQIDHGDSLGNSGSIYNGDCQWMTAGSGIIHQEMPQPSGRMQGFQLWLNLPAAHKMTPPKYNGILNSEIPTITDASSEVRVIAGNYEGTKGAFDGKFVKLLYLDITVKPNGEFSLSVPSEDTLFIYIFDGSAKFSGGEQVGNKHAVLFEKGDMFSLKALDEGVKFVLISAAPLGEPIAWGGPIVMNTREELSAAFEELENGTFIK